MNPLNWRVIEVLLERTLDDFPEGFLPASEVLATISFCLRVAATSGAITTLSMLISSTLVDINAQTGTGWTALHIAVSRGHFKAAKLLLEGGANPNITTSANFACIHVAIEAEYSEAEKLAMAELLIEHGAGTYKAWLQYL
jgi:ankyrin repeat protein